MTFTVERKSVLAAAADEVWARVTTWEGVNDELRPILRMTVPRGARGMTIDSVEPGTRPGRAWILLGGLVPVDYDDLGLAEVEPGRRFRERSTTLSLRRWEHERTVAPRGTGCEVIDRLTFEPRVPGTGRIARAIVGALFGHRHRRLARRFAR
ncbi:MAG TPA: SRPBCC family protein [Solirubrobacteraceae bacterium]|jgi:ligand-binding SRPBCC domain-containing protein